MRCRCRRRCQLGLFAALSLSLHLIALLLVGLFFLRSDRPLAGGGGEVSVMIESMLPPHPSLLPRGEKGLAKSPPSPPSGRGVWGEGELQPGLGSGDVQGSDPLLAQIRARIERVKRYPLLAERMKIRGKVQVSFRIDRAGNPADLTVQHASGSEVLDKEALATIQRAGPFPLYEKPLSVWLHYGG